MSQEFDWEKFESQVMDILELMEFELEKNVNIDGTQIDILGKVKGTLGKVETYVIECKNYQGKIGKDMVVKFRTTISIINDTHPELNIRGLLVARNGFTKDARSFLGKLQNTITLSSYEDLIEGIIRFNSYFTKFELVETDNTESYASLSGEVKRRNIEIGLTEFYEDGFEYVKRIDSFLINDWLLSKSKIAVILSGGGTGKTRLCKFITQEIINKRRINKVKYRIPLYVDLRAGTTIQHAISKIMTDDYSVRNFSWKNFEVLLKKGLIFLILDGLDELGSRLSFEYFHQIIVEIEKYLIIGDVKILLTSRPEIFIDKSEEIRFFSSIEKETTFIKLNPLEEIQVKQLIEMGGLSNKASDKLWTTINELYDLKSMASNPLMLKILLDLPDKIILRDNLSPWFLYNTYFESSLKREAQKFVRRISPNKILIITELAWEWVDTRGLIIEWNTIIEKIQKYEEITNSDDLDAIARDFLVSNLLVRSEEGIKFKHLSFAEYLIARQLYTQFRSDDKSEFSKVYDRYSNLLLTNRVGIATLSPPEFAIQYLQFEDNLQVKQGILTNTRNLGFLLNSLNEEMKWRFINHQIDRINHILLEDSSKIFEVLDFFKSLTLGEVRNVPNSVFHVWKNLELKDRIDCLNSNENLTLLKGLWNFQEINQIKDLVESPQTTLPIYFTYSIFQDDVYIQFKNLYFEISNNELMIFDHKNVKLVSIPVLSISQKHLIELTKLREQQNQFVKKTRIDLLDDFISYAKNFQKVEKFKSVFIDILINQFQNNSQEIKDIFVIPPSIVLKALLNLGDQKMITFYLISLIMKLHTLSKRRSKPEEFKQLVTKVLLNYIDNLKIYHFKNNLFLFAHQNNTNEVHGGQKFLDELFYEIEIVSCSS